MTRTLPSMTAVQAMLFTSPTCPHCPAAKQFAEKYFGERDDIEFEHLITFTQEGAQKARQYQVQAVPTFVIVGDGFGRPIGASGTPPRQFMDKLIALAKGEIGVGELSR